MSEYGWSGNQVAEFVDAHAESVVWLVTSRLDTVDRLSGEQRAVLDRQARGFADAHEGDLVAWLNPTQAGRDLALSREGEGSGFFGRYLPNDPVEAFSAEALAERHSPGQVAKFDAAMGRLQEAARALGVTGLYVGGDGRIYG